MRSYLPPRLDRVRLGRLADAFVLLMAIWCAGLHRLAGEVRPEAVPLALLSTQWIYLRARRLPLPMVLLQNGEGGYPFRDAQEEGEPIFSGWPP